MSLINTCWKISIVLSLASIMFSYARNRLMAWVCLVGAIITCAIALWLLIGGTIQL